MRNRITSSASGAVLLILVSVSSALAIYSQDLGEIDAVSGATYSLYRFKTTAIRALRKASK